MKINTEFNDKAGHVLDRYVIPAMMAGVSLASQALAANALIQNAGLDVQSCLFGVIALGTAASAGYLFSQSAKDYQGHDSYQNPYQDYADIYFNTSPKDPYIFEPSSPYITGLQEPLKHDEYMGHQENVKETLDSEDVLYRVGFGRGTITPQEKLQEADDVGITRGPVGFRMSKPNM